MWCFSCGGLTTEAFRAFIEKSRINSGPEAGRGFPELVALDVSLNPVLDDRAIGW